ncbi:hypothetical protein MNB_SM-3-1126 [hydrothermal vent metagenome]|uniref:Uncharacterized protein n=1 Tax=hydrothermal vent metagenome TaxID=652676 RepID=A0A1W1D5C5_9ZZZZ
MKINIENILHSIDSVFKGKKKQEIQMIYIMVFGIIFSVSYLFFWDSSLAGFLQKQRELMALSKRVDSDKKYLKNNPPLKVVQLMQEIKKTEKKIIKLKDNNEYIRYKIKTISSLMYDKQAWGKYLLSISVYANENNIKIIDFTNKMVKNTKEFGHILDISLQFSGNYLHTLNFINSLEQSNLVVDIHDFDMKATDNLYTDLNISVWGIAY